MAKPFLNHGASEPSIGGLPAVGVSRAGRRFRRRWLALLVALAAIVALVAVAVPQLLTSGPSETIWQKITDGITNGTVPKDTALEAFAYVYGVDVPGVTVPNGSEGGDGPTSGSGVVRWVQANWSALTPDQQAVVDRYLAPATEAGTTQMTPAPTAAPSGGADHPRFQLAKFILSWPIDTDVAPDASSDLALAMANEVLTDIAHIGQRLNQPIITPGSWPNYRITLTVSDVYNAEALFLTQPAVNGTTGQYGPCHITAYKNAWENESVTGSGGVSPRLHVLITHEVVHCYQNVIWGSGAKAVTIPPWITEGTAMWLAADDTGVAEPTLADVWTKGYFGRSDTSLINRSYDAFGYYALLSHQGRDMWKLMAPAWQATAVALNPSEAFVSALDGDNSDIRDNWAESYLRQTSWGDPWIAYGFGLPDAAQIQQKPAQAQPEPGWTGSLPGRSNVVLSVASTSGEVVTVATNGLASVHDQGTDSATAFQNQTFCTADGGCICPPGTLLAGQDMATKKLSIPFVAAFNAPGGGSRYSITSYKLDDLCKRPATPAPSVQQPKGTPSQGPCGQSCTQTNGDPHMLTVNKVRYDFQAAGEFTLLKSADDSLDIQARQEPFGSGYASINTAIAAKVGSHRVGVYMTGTGLQARVDGTTVDLSAGAKDLGGGARIAPVAKGFEIDFPDGTQMWTLSVGRWGINAQIKPSAALRASGVGVLGTVVPGGLGVPALPDGTRLPAATSAAQQKATIDGQFADAWRLTDSTTLFDYDAGKSTSSYTVKPYPLDPKYGAVTDLSADQAATGTSACSAITDQGLHDNCVFDVGVTGQTGFADNYAAIQTFYDSGIAAATPTPARTAAANPTPGTVSGNVFTVTQGTTLGGYAVGTNDTVYLSVQTGNNKFSLIAFDPKAGKILTQVDEPALTPVHFAAGSVWLPGLKMDSNGHNCNITRVDATTLTEQATIATPCSAFGDVGVTASDGDAVWFVDISKLDLSTNKGAVITRIDPTTNAPGTSVPMPALGGYAYDSQGAFFYAGSDGTYYRLTTGSTAFESLGSFNKFFYTTPGGTGLWTQDSTAKTAEYFTAADTPQVTLQVGGGLVAGDTKAAYVEVQGVNASTGVREGQLWRYPVDGSTPAQIAAAPVLDGGPLSYFDNTHPIANGDGLLKIWTTHSGFQQLSLVLLQWTPVP